MRKLLMIPLCILFWGELNSKEIPEDLEIHWLVEVTVEYRPMFVSSDLIGRTDCTHRPFYVAPWVPEFVAEISAYSSTKRQTDSDPWIAANNRRVFKGGIATNALPCGTSLMMPDLFGDAVFTVNDRMNRRYQPLSQPNLKINLDVWMLDEGRAWQFDRIDGIRVVIVDYAGA